jgi:hypothetical protein
MSSEAVGAGIWRVCLTVVVLVLAEICGAQTTVVALEEILLHHQMYSLLQQYNELQISQRFSDNLHRQSSRENMEGKALSFDAYSQSPNSECP